MHLPGPTVIGWLSQRGNDAIDVARQGYNHELYSAIAHRCFCSGPTAKTLLKIVAPPPTEPFRNRHRPKYAM
jgi:hypothetical protein